MKNKIVSSALLSVMLLSCSAPAFAHYYDEADIEHVQATDKTKIDLVKVTPSGNIIQKENYIVVNFSQNFNSKYYKRGDHVQFSFDEDLKTDEGTLLIPKGSSLIARISSIEDPRWFSRNARVYMEFTHILFKDGNSIPVYVQRANKEYFKEGAKETAGKIAGYTLAFGGVGCGMGAAIGSATGQTIGGMIVGGSIGGGVGLITGIVTPGLHFKAKKGEAVILELRDNLKIPNNL